VEGNIEKGSSEWGGWSAIHVGSEKYRTKDKNTQNTETKHYPEKAKHSKTKLPSLVVFYNTRPGNKVGLF